MTNLTEQLNALLPQTHCRQCGFSGCLPYAQALAQHKTASNLCIMGKAEAFLFGEMVQYMSSKSSNDKDFDLEEKLSSLGYPIGEKVLELCSVREKNFKKETKIVQMLQFIHNNVWKMLFGKQADGLQKSNEDEDEYRIIEISPITNKYIPFQKAQSNCAAFLGGIIEGILNSADFRCKVSTFFFDVDGIMKTYYIVKFDHDIIVRDAGMK